MSDKLILPMLARDVDESKLKFPSHGLVVMQKIDGSYGFIQNSTLYARSLKKHENIFTTNLYSNPDFEGLRGELIAGDNPVAPDLCRNTSSALRTIQGQPSTTLWCFDYVTHDTKDLPYEKRYILLEAVVDTLSAKYNYIKIIPAYRAFNLEQYLELRNKFLSEGYEGCIVRDSKAKHKEGRSSAVKPELWRWKPWSSAEIKVTNLVQEMQNMNEAKKNELGKTERSSHKDNKVPKGTLGAIQGNLVTPLRDYTGKVVADVGTFITVSTGCLTAKDCKYYWDNPSEMLDKIVEFDYMSFGLKDNGRFNQFKRIRSSNDM